MTEPTEEQPVIPAPEHTHGPHGHGSGIPWLDMIVAVSAVFISVVSLVVSIEHGRTMEKMVDQNERSLAAATMPILMVSIEQGVVKDQKHIRLTVKNSGVGPALIDRFEIRYKGVSYPNPTELLRACCGSTVPAGKSIDGIDSFGVTGSILPAREAISPITINPPAPAAIFSNLEAAYRDFSWHACYCSVLDECWQTDFDQRRPTPVDKCTVNKGEKLW
jgi:hypothetical protein